MKLAAVTVLAVSLASAVMAEMKPGFVVSSGPPFPIVADFNGDGLDDVIGERQVILNSGGSLTAQHDLGIPEGEKVVGVLDVNGDGRLDLLTMGETVKVPSYLPQPPMQTPGFRLYIANAQRMYSTGIGVSTGARPYIADVDSNGKDDFVVMGEVFDAQHRHQGVDVTVLRSRGDGTFDASPSFRIGTSPQITPDSRVQSGDLNHDGSTDLVIRTVSELVTLLGSGDGRFTVKSRYLPIGDAFGSQSMRIGDIDGDANLDVIMPAMRGVRVLFGDGRGNFTRSTRARIAKTHDLIGLPAGIYNGENAMQPRNVVLGHFTRDQLQIAAGTGEGDIVILGYEQGGLREVSRTVTEFWFLELRGGSFHGNGGTDLYAIGTLIWGEPWPKPRLFYGADDAIAAGTTTRSASRRRAAGFAPGVALRMQMQAECVDQAAERWSFAREGVFGVAQRGGATIEAVFDEEQIFYRMNAPFAGETVYGTLTEANGSWSGTTHVLTSCGWKAMTVTANME